jgi:hypothetical protein
MPAELNTGRSGTRNQCSGILPGVPGAYSGKAVSGTSHRRSRSVSADLQNGLVRLRTLVTGLLIGLPLAPVTTWGKPTT